MVDNDDDDDDISKIRRGDIFFQEEKYTEAIEMYVSAYKFQVEKYGTANNEVIFETLNKTAETCARKKEFNDALSIYQDIRRRAANIGIQDITFFCKLELSFATSSRDAGKTYLSTEDYNRIERQFRYYEEIIEKLCSTDTFEEHFDRVISIYSDMVNSLSHENIIALRMGLLIGHMYRLMGKHKISLIYNEDVYQKCLLFRGTNHPLTFLCCLHIVNALRDLCHFEEAFCVLNDYRMKSINCSNIISEAHAEATQKMLCECGNIFYAEGRYPLAAEFYRQACDYQTQLHEPGDRLILHAERMLGNIFFKDGDYRKALLTLANVFHRQAQYPDNRDILLTISDIVEIMKQQRDYDEALKVCRTIWEINFPTQIDLIRAGNEIAIILTKQHELEDAELKFKLLLGKCREMKYPNSCVTSIQNGLAMAYCEEGRYDDAIEIYEEIIKKRTDYLGYYHADTLSVEYNLGRVYEKCDNLPEALARYRRIRDLRRAIFHRAHPDCLSIDDHIAEILSNQNVHEEAFRIYCDLNDTIACFYGTDCSKRCEFKVKMRIAADRIKGEPRLITATRKGNLQEIRDCLEKGDDVNNRDNTGCAALHIACRKGFNGAVLLLLKSGANYEIQNWTSRTPLAVASTPFITEVLEQTRRLFKSVKDIEGEEMLNVVREIENNERLEAIFNTKDNTGYTLLHWASSMLSRSNTDELYTCVPIVELLLRNGADIKSVTKEGYLALHLAVMARDEISFEVLLDHLNSHYEREFITIINDQKNDKGSTLLHIAVVSNLMETVINLLKCGANPSVRNKLGKLPIELARDNEVKKLLR